MGAIRTRQGVLRVERERIEITSLSPRQDKDWVHIDHQRHEHRWLDDGYPTLVGVTDRIYWCEDCRDEHEDTHLECAICGEHIVPGTVGPSPFREYMPGPTSYYLDDEPISEEQAHEIMKAARPPD